MFAADAKNRSKEECVSPHRTKGSALNSLLIIFARPPEEGVGKTRLRPILSKVQIVHLQKAFIFDTLCLTDPLSCQRLLALSDCDSDFLKQCQRGRTLLFAQQTGTALGERMWNAFQVGTRAGFDKIVMIGCDSPTLPIDFVRDAFDCLSSHDTVVGPSCDGGYYLIGFKRPLPIPMSFDGISWGTSSVLTQTLRKMKEGVVALLPFWYDVDRPEDFEFLKEHLIWMARNGIPTPLHTREFIETTLRDDRPFGSG